MKVWSGEVGKILGRNNTTSSRDLQMVSNREDLKLNARLFQNQVLSIEDLQQNSYSAIRLMSTSTPAIGF